MRILGDITKDAKYELDVLNQYFIILVKEEDKEKGYIKANADQIRARLIKNKKEFYQRLNNIRAYSPKEFLDDVEARYNSLENRIYANLGLSRIIIPEDST